MTSTGTTAPDVFLSYAREDEEEAGRFASLLEKEGLSVWWDRKIPPGRTWDQVIGKALDEARCVVVLWTPASVESDWVKEEAARAARRGALVPVLLQQAQAPLGFGRIEAAELSGWRGQTQDQEFQGFLAAVRELATGDGAAPAATPPVRTSNGSRGQRNLRLAGVVAALAVLVVIGWLELGRSRAVLDVKLWNIERDRKTDVLAARSFGLATRGEAADEVLGEVVAWVRAAVVAPGPASSPVQIDMTVPADLERERIEIRSEPAIELVTYLYLVNASRKERLRSQLRPEDLEFVAAEEFTIEISAKGYDSLPVKIRKGQAEERLLQLNRLPVRVAIEEFGGAENRVAAQLTELLADPGAGDPSRLMILGPQALEELRREIAQVREATGFNRMAQVAIRDSLGVDYIMGGTYSER